MYEVKKVYFAKHFRIRCSRSPKTAGVWTEEEEVGETEIFLSTMRDEIITAIFETAEKSAVTL